MTQHAIAREMGELVYRYAAANGGSRRRAAEAVVEDKFPDLSVRNRMFVVWALLRAETNYMREMRPPLLSVGQHAVDAQDHHAPDGSDNNPPAAGQRGCDTQRYSAPAGNNDSDDGVDGGQDVDDAQGVFAPVSRRRLALARSGPEDYPVYVPGVGRKRLGDLTRSDIGKLQTDARVRREHVEQKERGWRRIYKKLPDDTRLADAMDNLSDSDRRFLADEFGIEEWREVA